MKRCILYLSRWMLIFFFLPICIFAAPKKIQILPKELKKKVTIHKKVENFSLRTKRPLIILDPGHGGSDEGAKIQHLIEKKLTLRTCYFTKKELESRGFQVILTRANDISISLNRRVEIANQKKTALFVSIHYNASVNAMAKGIEIFYYGSKQKQRLFSSKKLANCILFQLVDQTEAISRGIKQGNFHVIRETSIPAVLIEAGFLTNVEERKLLGTTDYLHKIAKGIALGIEKYLKS